jgi:hypothetical protein
MRMIRPKPTPSRLDPVLYESLRQQILRRDSWRCQSCGTMSNLEVHHKQFRSHSGHDSEENLITLMLRVPCIRSPASEGMGILSALKDHPALPFLLHFANRSKRD